MLKLDDVASSGKFPEPTQEIRDNQVLFCLYGACLKVYRRGFHAGLAERKKRKKLKAMAQTDKEKALFEQFIRSYTAGFHSAMKKDNSEAIKNNAVSLDSILKPEGKAPEGAGKAPPQGPQGPPQAKAQKAKAAPKPPEGPQGPAKPQGGGRPQSPAKPQVRTLKRAKPLLKGPPQTLKRSRIAASMSGRDSRGLFEGRGRARYL